MKKKIAVFLIMMFILPISAFADTIYSVNMDINILKDGTTNIKETWDVKADSGSEWYKTMYELNNSELTNYKVLMDGKELNYKNWDVNENLDEKSGYYGINHTSKGIELCFGKSDYQRHTFVISYTLSNYVFNVDDAQVLAWVIYPKADVNQFSAEISSYYKFPDTLDVWGYGYKGYAYVEDGVIKISTENSLNDEYVSVLVKFPLNTFNTTNTDSRYQTFDDVYKVAEEGTFEHDYSADYNNVVSSYLIILFLLFTIIPVIAILISSKKGIFGNYGYIENKTITKRNTPMFREIPCDKDIYYANALIKLNNFNYVGSNIFGAIILKWVKNNKIIFINEKKGVFNKETTKLDLRSNPTFDNENETKLFEMMYKASKDGILESKELEKWCKKNYSKFLKFFDKLENSKIDELKEKGHIYKRKSRRECKRRYVMDDKIYDDSSKLFGLKLYLEEFSSMDTKEVLDVHLWDEYLMFAYLFGIADKVAKQLKKLYPEVASQMDFDCDTVIFINSISRLGMSSASAARSARMAALNYHSGGGGFSSGGGGGFSGGFSGGGGGSAGGR